MKMKAITIWQPWASLIAQGLKKYETRHWQTPYRGLIAIHAGKQWTPKEQAVHAELMRQFPQIQGKLGGSELPLGAIICVCNLVDCIPTDKLKDLTDLERSVGDFSPKRFAWRLQVVRVSPSPIETAGKQGLWDWYYQMPNANSGKPKAYLDTETTGLGDDARILEIAIVDENENVLMDTYVNPKTAIAPDSIAVHGITEDMVTDAPTMAELSERVLAIFDKYEVCIFNADYDTRLLCQSALGFSRVSATCVMKPFSELIGEKNNSGRGYRYQSLAKACGYFEVTNPHPHRALGDAISTCRVHKAMLAKAVQ